MSFGGWAISEELHAWLVENLPPGKIILELGSGEGTSELVKRWSVCSVEHDEQWVGKEPGAVYCHAPLEAGWYSLRALEPLAREGKYDALIIDGPPGRSRGGFVQHMDMFDASVPWIFDDLQRHQDLRDAARVASRRGCALQVYNCADGKEFGVIHPDNRLPA